MSDNRLVKSLIVPAIELNATTTAQQAVVEMRLLYLISKVFMNVRGIKNLNGNFMMIARHQI
jgi:hypothetical protein